MINEAFIKKLEDKRFYKQVTQDNGLTMLLLGLGHKVFMAGRKKAINDQVMLAYHGSTSADDEDEYGIFAAPLNPEGVVELPIIKNEMADMGLLDNIGQMRYEGQYASGVVNVDPWSAFKNRDQMTPEAIAGYSTPNLLVYVLISEPKKTSLKALDKVVSLEHPKRGRCVFPFQSSFLSS